MTNDELSQAIMDLKALAETVPYWLKSETDDLMHYPLDKFSDWKTKEYIVGACNLAPALVERIEALTAENKRLGEALAKCNAPTIVRNDGGDITMFHRCMICGWRGEYLCGMQLEDHDPKCEWRKAREAQK